MKQVIYIYILCLAIAIPSYAQLQPAKEKSSPFSAVKQDGQRTMVLVEGSWYEILAIKGMAASHVIGFCQASYGDNWIRAFSEDIVAIMKKLKTPLDEVVELQLLDGGQRIPKKVLVSKKNYTAAWTYNNLHLGTTTQKANSPVYVAQDKKRPYPFKSARVEYVLMTDKKMTGKQTLYIDNYGETVLVITDITKPTRVFTTNLWHNNEGRIADHQTKTYRITTQQPDNTLPSPVIYMSQQGRKQAGYVRNDDETIAQYNCQVFEHPQHGAKHWFWQGVELQNKHTSGARRVATGVVENITIPPVLLDPPKGYTKL